MGAAFYASTHDPLTAELEHSFNLTFQSWI